MIDERKIQEFLKLKNGRLFHREGQELEFKEQFNFSALADYLKDFSGFANNRGGYLLFGIRDAPREIVGLSEKSHEQFEKIDPGRISGFINDLFSSCIEWSQACYDINGKQVGVFQIREAATKPVIARRDEGKEQTIKNGEIYYRYGGRTQKILGAELERIIARRVQKNNNQWLDLMAKIGKAGPANAAILDTERSLLQKGDRTILIIDDALAARLKFIKEGEFSETDGALTLKLVGDVAPIDKIEIVQKVKEDLVKAYPFSARELANEVKKRLPETRQNIVWDTIRDNKIKGNPDYSAHVFANKSQQDKFEKNGLAPFSVPTIYNLNAVNFLCHVLNQKKS